MIKSCDTTLPLLQDNVIACALRLKKPVARLTYQDFLDDESIKYVADRYQIVTHDIVEQLQRKIEVGILSIRDKTMLHTAPHHDDILLGYHTYFMRNLKNNQHHVVYLTSGFNGVQDQYIVDAIEQIHQIDIQQALQYSYPQLLEMFAQAYQSKKYKDIVRCKQFIFIIVAAQTFDIHDAQEISNLFDWLCTIYFPSKLHAQQDILLVQQLKASIRESESESKWSLFANQIASIHHFRAEFYRAKKKNTEIDLQADVDRFVDYVQKKNPDIITVTCDPYEIGPKTHFATLQLVAQSIARYDNKNIEIWGYRNVWSSFSLGQASVIIPVTQDDIDQMESIFSNCFSTQNHVFVKNKDASMTFAMQSKSIQLEQWHAIQQLLGHDFFAQYPSNVVKDAVGAIFLTKMTLGQLLLLAS